MFQFKAHSIETSTWGRHVSQILNAALVSVDPAQALLRHVQRSGDRLMITGQIYQLDKFERVLLVGAGKAGAPMAQAVVELIGERVDAGVVIVKQGYANFEQPLPPEIEVLEAGHPLPDDRGVVGAHKIETLLSTTGADDLVICLISGGGSALMTSPAPNLTLTDLQSITNQLLACGATINEINILRKHLDQMKGGQLARLAAPAKLVTLILSDVVGDPLEVIASGPTVPDPSTFQQAQQILEKYHILKTTPAAIQERIRRGLQGEICETPKTGDPIFQTIQNQVIGSNYLAAQAAVEQAQRIGFNALLLTTFLQGEAQEAGKFLASLLSQSAATGQPVRRPACLVIGGETTVTLHGEGLGGRNQELALAAVESMAGLSQVALIALATDGGDGPTDSAGAVVTGETAWRAAQLGLEPAQFLANNDSYHFFEALDDLLKPGPTRTNVNDLNFIFAFEGEK